MRAAPIVRAGPLRWPAALWTSFTGVAFSWEEMPNWRTGKEKNTVREERSGMVLPLLWWVNPFCLLLTEYVNISLLYNLSFNWARTSKVWDFIKVILNTVDRGKDGRDIWETSWTDLPHGLEAVHHSVPRRQILLMMQFYPDPISFICIKFPRLQMKHDYIRKIQNIPTRVFCHRARITEKTFFYCICLNFNNTSIFFYKKGSLCGGPSLKFQCLGG